MNTAHVRTVARALSVTFFLGGTLLFAQDTPEKTTNSEPADIVYKSGTKGVTNPRAIYQPNPEYTEKARKKKLNGVVMLSIIVTPEGTVRDPVIARSLGYGLDEKALEAVRKWKFDPATKDGKPVAVQVAVEVNFRLY